MKVLKYFVVAVLILSITVPALSKGGPPPNRGGGKKDDSGEVPDTGTLYGDLYVNLRDENGVPILDANGCLQPISAVDGGILEIYDSTNTTVLFTTEAIAGEPFQLAFYTDADAEIEVECELTEEMADWVQTVDFGRLNLGRAPVHVIAHGFDEAVNKMNAATEIALDPAGRLVLTLPVYAEDGITIVGFADKTIDAPAENLALYIEMMTDGDWYTEDTTPIVMGAPPEGVGPPEGDGPSSEPRPRLCYELVDPDPTNPVYEWKEAVYINLYDLGLQDLCSDRINEADQNLTNAELQLAASLLAAAADKTGSITLDKVVYINFIYGINQLGSLSDEQDEDARKYFDFSSVVPDPDGGDDSPFDYNREGTFGTRGSAECEVDKGPGWIWVLQPFGALDDFTFKATCMEILGVENGTVDQENAVHFAELVESSHTMYEVINGVTTAVLDVDGNPVPHDFGNNVRGFAQAADDALQVIEYIHNYKIPVVLYP